MNLFKDLKDKNGNAWGIRKIKSELEKQGYKITQNRKSIKGKKNQYFTITI